MDKKTFKHITEDPRLLASDLWNEFNAKLDQNGMSLFYDHYNGSFFVASNELAGVCANKPGALTDDELEEVICEGGFGTDAVNNPPWFTTPGEYTLAPVEDA